MGFLDFWRQGDFCSSAEQDQVLKGLPNTSVASWTPEEVLFQLQWLCKAWPYKHSDRWWAGEHGNDACLTFEFCFRAISGLLSFNKVKKNPVDVTKKNSSSWKEKYPRPSFELWLFHNPCARANPGKVHLEVLFPESPSVLARCGTGTDDPKLNSLTGRDGTAFCAHWPSQFLVSGWWCGSGKWLQWAELEKLGRY